MNALLTIQDATVAALDELTGTNGATVDAWPVYVWDEAAMARVPQMATESCENDALHGKGVCYLPGMDGGCLACAIALIEANLVAGQLISVDVLA